MQRVWCAPAETAFRCSSLALFVACDMRVIEQKVLQGNPLAPYCPDDERPVQHTGQDSAIYFSDSAGKPLRAILPFGAHCNCIGFLYSGQAGLSATSPPLHKTGGFWWLCGRDRTKDMGERDE